MGSAPGIERQLDWDSSKWNMAWRLNDCYFAIVLHAAQRELHRTSNQLHATNIRAASSRSPDPLSVADTVGISSYGENLLIFDRVMAPSVGSAPPKQRLRTAERIAVA